VATLTFVYSDSTAVVGPLATVSEPHSWDLCVAHASRITAPRGWELVRHAGPLPAHPDEDDALIASVLDRLEEIGDRRRRAARRKARSIALGIGTIGALIALALLIQARLV